MYAVTDGSHTCDTDRVAWVRLLHAPHVRRMVNVVGLMWPPEGGVMKRSRNKLYCYGSMVSAQTVLLRRDRATQVWKPC